MNSKLQEIINKNFELATKWWFFPIFYLILCIVLASTLQYNGPVPTGYGGLYYNFSDLLIGSIIFLPLGIGYLFKDQTIRSLLVGLAYLNYLVILSTYILIMWLRYKKNFVFKPLIIFLILILLLSFKGCLS